MGLEQRDTPGWHVASTVESRGNLVFRVAKKGESKDEVDVVYRVNHWPFLKRLFRWRVRRTLEKAQKRAWLLNQNHTASSQIEYDLRAASKKKNPHDD